MLFLHVLTKNLYPSLTQLRNILNTEASRLKHELSSTNCSKDMAIDRKICRSLKVIFLVMFRIATEMKSERNSIPVVSRESKRIEDLSIGDT